MPFLAFNTPLFSVYEIEPWANNKVGAIFTKQFTYILSNFKCTIWLLWLKFSITIFMNHKFQLIKLLSAIKTLNWATFNYLKLHTPILSHLQIFEVIWSFVHLFRASCNNLKLLAPISSHLQLFQACSTYFKPLEIISSV